MHEKLKRKLDDSSLEKLLDWDLSPDELRQMVIASITGFERSFRTRFPALWFSTLIGPVVLTVAVLCAVTLLFGWSLANKFIWAALITFFVLGRFVILAGVDGQQAGWMAEFSLSPMQLFAMVTYMDFIVALFVSFHMGILFRIPWLGPKIAGLTSDSKFIMEQQPWIGRLAFLALVTFVAFPTSTTGSIGGSIFGRLLGLGRVRTVFGVFAGSVVGNGLMYYFAREINDLYNGPYSLALKLSGIVLMVAGVMAIELRYRKSKQQYLAEYSKRHEARERTG
jgi:uncharacterized membrane protein